jgi:hypothetical protein
MSWRHLFLVHYPGSFSDATTDGDGFHDEQEGDDALEGSTRHQDRDQDRARDETETRDRDGGDPVEPVGDVTVLRHLEKKK